MSMLDAVIQVLKEAGKPLHAKEITERILSKDLWKTTGKTPAATVSARLYSDIKKNEQASPFILHAPQTFGLRDARVPAETAVDIQPKAASTGVNRTQSKTYSFTDSAEKVLEQFGQKRPMHYRAITEKALEMGWLVTEGKTPEASMYAQILTEIKRYKRRGEQPRFVQHGKGFVGLSKWMGRGLAFEIEQHNKKIRQALHQRLLDMEWGAFEELIARLLAETGFEDIDVTNRNKDGGIDVRGILVVGDVIRTRMAIQVKKWKRNVQAPVVQQVRGSLGTHEQGLIITTSDFSTGARKEAARPDAIPVALMSGEQLVLLLIENGIGVCRRSHDLFELEEPSDTDADTNAAISNGQRT
jgi:restriction system protein